jgi:hypothetical protein
VQVQAQVADLEGSQLVASWRLALTTGQLQAITGKPFTSGTSSDVRAEQK